MKKLILLVSMFSIAAFAENVTSSYPMATMDAVDAAVIAQSNTWDGVTANTVTGALHTLQFTAQGATNTAVQIQFDAQDTSNTTAFVLVSDGITTNFHGLVIVNGQITGVSTSDTIYASDVVGTNGWKITFTNGIEHVGP